jgi:hypothetical protein
MRQSQARDRSKWSQADTMPNVRARLLSQIAAETVAFPHTPAIRRCQNQTGSARAHHRLLARYRLAAL